uniref:Putative nad-dependent methylenetetrahydrofolate dehydrogenase n=1 Tax=Ixodes ricinus TaxID=34613 RepID=A0A0K8RJ19_IXORI
MNLFMRTHRLFSSASVRRCSVSVKLEASRKVEVIDGKRIANEIETEIRSAIDSELVHGGRRPHLCAVLVGDDEGSAVYVKNKIKASERTGITSENIQPAIVNNAD